MDLEGVVSTVFQQISQDGWSALASGLPEEAALSIYVNGFELATFMCTQVQQDALALGFLANEGLIAGMDEVKVLHVCARGTCVDVWLSHAIQRPQRSIITSGCGGGLTFDDLTRQMEPLISDRQLRPARIHDLMREMYSAGERYLPLPGW